MTIRPLSRYRPGLQRSTIDGRNRADISPGARVRVVQKQDQRSGTLTDGTVGEILTCQSRGGRGANREANEEQIDSGLVSGILAAAG